MSLNMNPDKSNPTGIGLSQPGGDLGQLPPIQTPESFHAPETPAMHFDASVAPAVMPVQPPAHSTSAQGVVVSPKPTPDPLAQFQAVPPANEPPPEEVDTAFDEEWVNKAREVVSRTHEDPYLQSQALSKLKAQYIKARYNKDVKVSDE